MAIPKHVAIIPDGNRRWAKSKGLSPSEGHFEGVKRFWEVGDKLFQNGTEFVTFWSSSYDNLTKRSKLEIRFLMKLLREEVASDRVKSKLTENECRFNLVGEWREFVKDGKTVRAIESLEKETSRFTKRALTILFAYDGQREMLDAINSLNGQRATDKTIRANLWTGSLPDVDLVIRTGGEPHWSAGFMMWLTSHSQFHFTETLWPSFKTRQCEAALEDYAARERRAGK